MSRDREVNFEEDLYKVDFHIKITPLNSLSTKEKARRKFGRKKFAYECDDFSGFTRFIVPPDSLSLQSLHIKKIHLTQQNCEKILSRPKIESCLFEVIG